MPANRVQTDGAEIGVAWYTRTRSPSAASSGKGNATMHTLVLGLHLFGAKEIAVYVIVILAIIAFAVYSRRGTAGR